LDITPGNSPARQLRVEYQGCADAGLCYPPEIHTLDLPGAGGAPGVAESSDDDGSLGWSLLLLFAAGLALTFTPAYCPWCPFSPAWYWGEPTSTAPGPSSCRSAMCWAWP